MTSISKNMYIDKLDNIVNKYNNTYYRTIKIKSKVDKLYVDKLVPVPVDLSILSDVVKNEFVKRCLYV